MKWKCETCGEALPCFLELNSADVPANCPFGADDVVTPVWQKQIEPDGFQLEYQEDKDETIAYLKGCISQMQGAVKDQRLERWIQDARAAMQGLLHPDYELGEFSSVAHDAYMVADAMQSERDRRTGKTVSSDTELLCKATRQNAELSNAIAFTIHMDAKEGYNLHPDAIKKLMDALKYCEE